MCVLRVPCAVCRMPFWPLVCATELASAAELWTCRALLLDTHTMPCSASCSVRVGAVTDALSMRSRAGRRRSASAHEVHGEAQHAGLFDPRALKIGLSVPSDTRKGLEHCNRVFVRFWQNSPMCSPSAQDRAGSSHTRSSTASRASRAALPALSAAQPGRPVHARVRARRGARPAVLGPHQGFFTDARRATRRSASLPCIQAASIAEWLS